VDRRAGRSGDSDWHSMRVAGVIPRGNQVIDDREAHPLRLMPTAFQRRAPAVRY
jgi:hypothetical protein